MSFCNISCNNVLLQHIFMHGRTMMRFVKNHAVCIWSCGLHASLYFVCESTGLNYRLKLQLQERQQNDQLYTTTHAALRFSQNDNFMTWSAFETALPKLSVNCCAVLLDKTKRACLTGTQLGNKVTSSYTVNVLKFKGLIIPCWALLVTVVIFYKKNNY